MSCSTDLEVYVTTAGNDIADKVTVSVCAAQIVLNPMHHDLMT